MRHRRLLTPGAIAVAVVLGAPQEVRADSLTGDGDCRRVNRTTIRCGAETVRVTPGTPPRPSPRPSPPSPARPAPRRPARPAPPPAPAPPSYRDGSYGCSALRLSGAEAARAGLARRAGGAWYRVSCTQMGGSGSFSRTEWRADPPRAARPAPAPARPAVDPMRLAREASDQLRLGNPVIRMNPEATWEQVVHMPTWMWVDPAAWAPVSATADAGAVAVTATATPTSVVWDMGNGDSVTCAGPGTPYDRARSVSAQRTTCSYTYRRSSSGQPGQRFTVTATVLWDARWSATGIEGGGDLGTMRTNASVRVRVAELQALND